MFSKWRRKCWQYAMLAHTIQLQALITISCIRMKLNLEVAAADPAGETIGQFVHLLAV